MKREQRLQYLLHHLVEDSAASWPDRTAVEDGDRRLTYADLEAWSNRLANLLLRLGVRRGDRVGLFLDKSIESVAGIYGILKSGAAYVPFDPQAPVPRLAYIARNAGITHLITGAEKSVTWCELVAEGTPVERLIVLNAAKVEPGTVPRRVEPSTARDVEAEAPDVPAIDTIHSDLAYILYTSGSTGNPKGVMLTHLNALTFVDWTVDEFGVTAEDRLSSHAPFHFDLSVFDLFGAAKAGGTVVLVPREAVLFPSSLTEFIRERALTVTYSVPSALNMLVLRGNLEQDDFPTLRTMLFAGEVFPTKYLRRLMQLLPHVRFANLYGPTETNVCTWFKVPPLPEGRNEPIPIGKAIRNVQCYVVGDDGRVVDPGEVGELFVRGSTVMQGYWGDPARTAQSLLPNPFSHELTDRVYRTGDLVQELPDGNYRFLGRRDSQIKSRGYRIELGDIEAALYAHPQVVECAVVAVPDDVVTNRLRAYVVASDRLDAAALVRFCSERIPRYMIPDGFEFVEALPKTSTGKVERVALRDAASATPAAG